MILHLDFETRGSVELKDVGIHNYATHPDTDIWCVGFAFDDQEPLICLPRKGKPTWALPDTLVVSHNAPFELAIWNHILVPRYGWPVLRPEQTRCTMAMAYAMALPASLEKAAAAVGITEQKDLVGGRLMMQMAKPKGGQPGAWVWWDEPERLEKLYDYCKQDVRVERALHKRLLELTPREQKIWAVDHTINSRGIYVDRPAIQAAVEIVRLETDRLNKDLRRVTGNAVGFTSEVAQLTKWIRSRGVPMDGIAKAEVLDTLALDTVPQDVREALLIRQEAGRTSTAKLQTMLDAASPDGRVRDTMQYHGASTGRWAGRRVQPHNLPRPKLTPDDVTRILDHLPHVPIERAMAYMDVFHGSPISVVSDCLRGMICAPPGHTLMAADFANIEGRVLAWLAGETWKVAAFRAFDAGTGPDMYKLSYSKSFNTPVADVTKDQRQIGKVQELALGYQGGVGAFQTMARNYGVVISDERADQIKHGWRDAHPRTVQFWYDVEAAAVHAATHPGVVTTVQERIKFKRTGSFLFCQLPSGRAICYPYPVVKAKTTPWGEDKEQLHYKTVGSLSHKWEETHTYGGKLTENIVQAIARDILAEAILRCEADNLPVVLHVHDEVVTEVLTHHAEGRFPLFLNIVAAVPPWAAGLPIAVEGWRGTRYRK